ncbi:hypothetical protein GPECTOR_16g560 [Gonium pectorale]|uniref:Uncharacterized protein n=1 Tax=Gonium pectorale TaxID=33097 RepID=A0A150GKS3_GONPE|nr:hypothetical protein GPECTOR_16g560 [Gonium pectorale]|eukprot:KXZ50387.1 hypothetical protein GPECTOR_16g560 [Gonium pectorale]
MAPGIPGAAVATSAHQAAGSGNQQPQSAAASSNVTYKYKYAGSVQEDHKTPLFCVTFNTYDLRHRDLLATVGRYRATIYRLLPSGQFEVVQRGRQSSDDGGVDEPAEDSADEDAASAAIGADCGGGGGGRRGGSRGGGGAGGLTETGESFYACKWSRDEASGAALLLVAGEKALMRVLDVSRGCLVATLSGHGKGINDIAVHPSRPHLVLTGSDDESVRLWNIRTRTCVAIFSGEGGHRNKVLSLDFHPWDGHRFLSSGMDCAIKIWSVAALERLIADSEMAVDGCVGGGIGSGSGQQRPAAAGSQPGSSGGDAGDAPAATATGAEADGGGGQQAAAAAVNSALLVGARRAFPTRVVQLPLFSTLRVHNDYVDCVRWMGDLVLSKSVHDVITLWRPHCQQQQQQGRQGRQVTRPAGGRSGSSSAAGGSGGDVHGSGGDGGDGDLDDDGDVGLSSSWRMGGEMVASQATKITDFQLAESYRTWWVRFSADLRYTVLACGSAGGKVFVFSPQVGNAASTTQARVKLAAPQCKKVVRQTAVSWDGSTILAACEDGSLHRWDRDAVAAAGVGAGGSGADE